ncbi:ArsR family transcriptional regulator [Streptomyces sp. NPDC087440]|uniref:ArsR family transcriptional regulator n=1 Tax=Streptomyces sp. NPDC087440 TaxID=3365790 RepID=UPI00382E2C71
MKTSPSLLPLLRSQLQGDLLALTLLHPEQPYTLGDLAEQLRVSHTSVLREVNRLIEAGILTDRRVGRTRLVTVRTDTPLARPLTDLIAAAFGPVPLLTDALSEVPGATRAYLYGPWAARYNGENGPPPTDIDLLVVGDPDPDELSAAIVQPAHRLRREVNVHLTTPAAWSTPTDDPTLATIHAQPLVELPLTHTPITTWGTWD